MEKVTAVRGVEGRLFPSLEWDSGWIVSLQADRAGYACRPRERLERLEDYEAVEAVIYHSGLSVVDPQTLDLPPEVAGKFSPVEAHCPSIGAFLSWSDVDALRDALNRASLNPNAGVPRGTVLWAGRDIWHGTSSESAADIRDHGIRMDACTPGYFGQAFYAADDRALSVSNYAEAFDDDAGAVVHLRISDGANILDLRNPVDSEAWAPFANVVGRPDFNRMMRKNGIHGVYDRSMGGLAIFDERSVEVVGVEFLSEVRAPQP